MFTKTKGVRILTSVIGIILCVVFSVSLIVNIVIIVKGFSDPNNPPSVFGVVPMVVQSGSMSVWNDADDHSAGYVVHKVFPDEVADLDRDGIAALKKGDVIWSYEEEYKVRNEVVSVVDGGDDGVWINTVRPTDDHIEVGDMIFTKKIDVKDLKVGDVISYLEDSIVVTHRIIKIDTAEDGSLKFVTKGDANLSKDDEPIDQSKVVGIYKWRIAKIGDLAMFMQKPLGMLLFVGVPLLAFIVYDIIRRQATAAKAGNKDAEHIREKEELERQAAEMQAEIERLRSLAEKQTDQDKSDDVKEGNLEDGKEEKSEDAE